MRATHNLFLKKNINLTQPIANVGSGKKSEYTKYICKDDTEISGGKRNILQYGSS